MTFEEATAHINELGYRVCNLFQYESLDCWQAGVTKLPPGSYEAWYSQGTTPAEAIVKATYAAVANKLSRNLHNSSPRKSARDLLSEKLGLVG